MSSRIKNLYIGKRLTVLLVFLGFLLISKRYNQDLLGYDLSLRLQDFFTIFLGLIVEASPFILVGVIVSIIVALFFKEEWLMRIMPKNRFLSHIVFSVSGFLMPVCECGNVPVVRRLILKGFAPSHAITFLLAAPILNPITIWATLEAFSFDSNIALIRVIAALIIANMIGILFSYYNNPEKILSTSFYREVCDHEHHNEKLSLSNIFNIFQKEFLSVFAMMVVGALIAASFQTFIPRSVITGIGQDPFLSVITMIIMAFVISICANVDAFFARTYVSSFTIGSLVSFMVFGPMIDIKMLTMLRKSFKTWPLIVIVSLVFISSVIVGLLVTLIY